MAEDYAELVRMLRYDSDVARPYRVVAADAITALIAVRDALKAEKDALIELLLAAIPNAADRIAEVRAALNQGGSND